MYNRSSLRRVLASSLRGVSLRVGSACLGFGLAASLPVEANAADAWPSRVVAVYKVSFNGFDIGSFRFESAIGAQGYTADGNAELSALLGAFTWQGITRVAGNLDASNPHPAGYSFDFRSSSRTGSVKLGFRQDNVTSVSMVPPAEFTGEEVPVKEQHLKGVLDPLSAVLALARAPQSNDPCNRKLSIFDGKQRFDLVLSHRRDERIAPAHGAQADVVHVCRVRFVPIAGHKRNEETRNLAEQTGIEVALRPVPSANIYVPHQITVPTGLGSAVLTAQRIDIQGASMGAIALTD